MLRTATAYRFAPDEAPVSSTELLETHVVFLRTDLKDLRAEFRAAIERIDHDIRVMAATAESEIKAAVARFDEQFREVRADIRELRTDNKSLHDNVDANYLALDTKSDGSYQALDRKITESYQALDKKIDDSHQALDRKITEGYQALDKKIDANYQALDRKIDAAVGKLDAKADANFLTLDRKIDTNYEKLMATIEEMRGDIADLKGLMKGVIWAVGGVGTLGAIVSVAFTIAKILNWL